MVARKHLVDTVAELTSATINPKADLKDGQQITVAGYYAAGDMEVVTYVWDAASTATADGGSVLAHDEGGDGRFLLAKDTITARDFGAIGDGGTDDTAAVQQFFDAISGRAGILPPGTYNITDDLTLPASFDLIGLPGSILDGVDNTIDILHTGIDGASISGVRLTRFRRALDGQSNWTKRFRVERCEIDNCNDGLRCPGPAESVYVGHNYIHDIVNEGECSAIQFGESVSNDLEDQPNNIVEHNRIENIENTESANRDVHAVLLRGLNPKILNNHVSEIISAGGVGCEGLYMVGIGGHISGNYLLNAAQTTEGMITVKGNAIPGTTVIIENNELVCTRASPRGIATYISGSIIRGNTLRGFSSTSIGITGQSTPRGVIVEGNVFDKFGGNIGIKVHRRDWIVRRNKFYLPVAAGSIDYGIYIGDLTEEHNNNNISDNEFIIDSTLTSTEYRCIDIQAQTYKVDGLFALNNKAENHDNTSTLLRLYAFHGSSGNSLGSTGLILSGQVSGAWSEVLRKPGGDWPTTMHLDIFDGQRVKTAAFDVTLPWYVFGGDYLITNYGSSSTRTYILKASHPGMRLRFYRSGTGAMRIDPAGSEIIGGGGAGKYMDLDAQGVAVEIECIVAGVWIVTSQVGSVSYEP